MGSNQIPVPIALDKRTVDVRIPVLACGFAAVALWCPEVSGRTWYVAADGSGDAPTIQAAVDSAATDDIIELESGVFIGPGNRDVHVTKELTIQSTADAIIDCEASAADQHRALRLSAACELRGLTIRHGCVLDQGPYYGGGAVWIDHVPARVVGCTFEDNVAGGGGAIACLGQIDSPPEIHVEGTAFRRNHAGFQDRQGAVSLFAARVYFRACEFIANDLGAVGYIVGSAHFTDCVVADNVGGAIFCGDSGSAIGCTFVGNSPSHITVTEYQRFPISNSILAFARGPAVSCAEGQPNIAMSCSDVFGNEGGDYVDCIVDESGIHDNISLDPLFCDLAAGDYTLRSDSPAANAPCDQMGALGVGCGPSAVARSRWSQVKSLYR